MIHRQIKTIKSIDLSKGFYYSSFFFLILVEFALGAIFSRILTEENFRFYIQIANYLPLFTIITNLGIGFSIVFFISRNEHIKKLVFQSAQRLNAQWASIVIFFTFLLYFLFPQNITFSIALASIISIPYAFRNNINQYYLAQKDFTAATLSGISQKLLLLVVVLICFLSPSMTMVLNQQFNFAYPALESLVLFIFFFYTLREIAFKDLFRKGGYERRILRYGRYVGINSILSVCFYSALTFSLSLSEVATSKQIILGLCFIYLRYSGIVISPLISIITPDIVRNIHNRGALLKIYYQYSFLFLGIALISILLIMCLMGNVIGYLFDERYRLFPEYFRYFYCLLPVLYLVSLNGAFVNAIGKVKKSLRVEVFMTAFILIFVVIVFFYTDIPWFVFVWVTYFYYIGKLILYYLAVNSEK